jgi:hypothetical protein
MAPGKPKINLALWGQNGDIHAALDYVVGFPHGGSSSERSSVMI